MASAVKILKHFETPKKSGLYYRLVCLTGENKGKAYFLLGNRVVMGRSDKCDITVLDLKAHREHAEIVLVGKDYVLTDIGTRNGVIINDLKIKQHSLTDGDKVIIGKTVYKFSRIEVKEEAAAKKPKPKKKNEQEVEEEKEPENKKLIMILVGAALLGVLLLVDEEANQADIKIKGKDNYQVSEIDESVAKAIKRRALDDKKNKEKLKYYFDRGLREYREGNYQRAIAEFENAQQWSPNDPNANYYLRKTNEKLNEYADSLSNKAQKETESLNYYKAASSYCSILRLLQRVPNHKNYISAEKEIQKLKEDKGIEVECRLKKGDDK